MSAIGAGLTNLTDSQATDLMTAWRPACGSHLFSDIPAWLDTAARWAWCSSFVSGYPDGTFQPDRDITRGQLANMLWGIYA